MEALSADIDRKLKALVRAGYYSSKLEVMKDAISSLFRENAQLKISADNRKIWIGI